MTLPRPLQTAATWFRRSPALQYLLYLVVAGQISIVLSLELLYPRLVEARAEGYRAFTEALLKESPSAAGLPDMHRIEPFRQFMRYDYWVTDDKGTVLARSDTAPLPVAWELIQLPKEELVPLATRIPGMWYRDLFTLRLIHKEPRYLTYLPSETNPFAQLLRGYVTLLLWWLFGVQVLGMAFLLKWKPSPPLPKKNPEAGFSLISALLALAIAAIGMVAMQKMLAVTFRGSSHADLRGNIRSLSDTLKKNVSCAKTFQGIDLKKACDPKSLMPLVLKDRNGTPLTNGLLQSTGAFSPVDTTLNGSGQIGNWYLRSYCEPDGNLVIRFARPSSSAIASSVSFYSDPLTKRDYGWGGSDSNPLFGTPDRVLCRGEFSSGGQHIIAAPMRALPVGDPARNCTPSFTKNGKLYLLAIGAAEYTLLMPDSTLVAATIYCPDGQIAVGGGAQCGAGFSTASTVALVGGGGHAPGYLSASQPTADGKGWSSACCVEGIPNQSALAYAVCVPNPN